MLQPIDNGEYLHEKIAKYSTIGDYEIRPNDAVAIYVDSVSPANFVAKFQFADLCQCVKSLAFNRDIKYPVKLIREATLADGNRYPEYENSIKEGAPLASNSLVAGIQKPLSEKKFSTIVILGECDDKMLDYLKDDQNAMDLNEVLPGSGVYRRLG